MIVLEDYLHENKILYFEGNDPDGAKVFDKIHNLLSVDELGVFLRIHPFNSQTWIYCSFVNNPLVTVLQGKLVTINKTPVVIEEVSVYKINFREVSTLKLSLI